MNYYTSTVPDTLAEKLKEKGMNIFVEQEWYDNGMPKAVKDCHKPMTKFCEVFDWLAEKDIYLSIMQQWVYADGEATAWIPVVNCHSNGFYDTWHEAATKAIEKALTLI